MGNDVAGNGYLYGLRDIKIITSTEAIDLPASQTLQFSEVITSDQLRGDDVIVSTVAFPEGIEFTLEAGGIDLKAWAALTGESIVTAGTTPNRTETFTRHGAQNFPYVKIYGRSLGDGIDSVHLLIPKAKLTSLEGTLALQSFFMTSASGTAVADGTNILYQVVKLETDAELPTS